MINDWIHEPPPPGPAITADLAADLLQGEDVAPEILDWIRQIPGMTSLAGWRNVVAILAGEVDPILVELGAEEFDRIENAPIERDWPPLVHHLRRQLGEALALLRAERRQDAAILLACLPQVLPPGGGPFAVPEPDFPTALAAAHLESLARCVHSWLGLDGLDLASVVQRALTRIDVEHADVLAGTDA